jgi:hypothetical protein
VLSLAKWAGKGQKGKGEKWRHYGWMCGLVEVCVEPRGKVAHAKETLIVRNRKRWRV